MKLLHLIATPRLTNSNTLRVSKSFIDTLKAIQPALRVQTIDLAQEDLPATTSAIIDTKYREFSAKNQDELKRQSWSEVEARIHQFMAVNLYLITTPMWNYSIPYTLKYYIDSIIQPKYTFGISETGDPIPLLHDRKMICITSRDRDFSPGRPLHALDFQEPYLRAVFGSIGIEDIQFINLQPMGAAPDIREAKILEGIEQAKQLATEIGNALVGSDSEAVEA
jgi:FMN-dependent NADH-azoreductase